MLDLGERTIHKIEVTIVVEPDGDMFHAYAPALKGLHVDGKTKEEALSNAEEAIGVYLKSLAEHDDPLPVGPDLTVSRERMPAIPAGAFLRSVTISWRCPNTSGSK
jgi:predicted RNase H-like HicB family nuclease